MGGIIVAARVATVGWPPFVDYHILCYHGGEHGTLIAELLQTTALSARLTLAKGFATRSAHPE